MRIMTLQSFNAYRTALEFNNYRITIEVLESPNRDLVQKLLATTKTSKTSKTSKITDDRIILSINTTTAEYDIQQYTPVMHLKIVIDVLGYFTELDTPQDKFLYSLKLCSGRASFSGSDFIEIHSFDHSFAHSSSKMYYDKSKGIAALALNAGVYTLSNQYGMVFRLLNDFFTVHKVNRVGCNPSIVDNRSILLQSKINPNKMYYIQDIKNAQV